MIPGTATPEGTARFAARAAGFAAPGHFRPGPAGLMLSSLGLGTYLGNSDDATDAAVMQAAAFSIAGGLNVLDTAINYRSQRAERCLGAVLQRLVSSGRLDRSEVFVSTKAGYIPYDGAPPADRVRYIRDTYLGPKIIAPSDLVGGIQCIAPAYLLDQIRRSRANLRLATLDLFHLHNPEYMIPALGRNEWRRRIELAFRTLEDAVRQGLIASYGTATWDGYRVGAERPDHLELSELLELARHVGGADHHFRAIQLPISLSAREAVCEPTQTPDGRPATVLEAASAAGVAVFASAPLLQGQALGETPPEPSHAALTTPGQRALQWVRTRPGVLCVLVGMKSEAHVRENLALAGVAAQ
jgi:aryl-alcohol dehydrogenase-like predicted oxidoreductase